jgi:hypothetical protein
VTQEAYDKAREALANVSTANLAKLRGLANTPAKAKALVDEAASRRGKR